MTQPISLPAATPAYDVLWERQVQAAINALGAQRATVQLVPATGFSTTIPNGNGCLMLQPTGALATGTVTLPAQAAEGFEQQIVSTQTVTTLTVVANTGQTLLGSAPAALTAYRAIAFRYVAATMTWVQVR